MNVLLAQHIDGLYCDEDGNIRLRTSQLGVISNVLDLIPRTEAVASTDPSCGIAEQHA